MKWYLKCLRHYADFSGRASRQEYWMFVLFNVIFCAIAIGLDNLLGLTFRGLYYGLFYLIYCLVVFLPNLAVNIRRLHDIGKSGWMIFVAFIPIVGEIWFLILMLTESSYEDNEYGTCPISIPEPIEIQNTQSGEKTQNIYVDLIQNAINDERITGIIPVNPAGLKLRFANISFTPTLMDKLGIALLSISILLMPTSLFLFVMADFLSLGIIVLYGIFAFFIVRWVSLYYVKHIKKYSAKIFLAITDKDLHCIFIENYRLKMHHRFNVQPSNLGKHFYGEINKRTKKIKERFEIHLGGIIQAKGKISLKNGQLFSEELPFELMLPLIELKKIYLS